MISTPAIVRVLAAEVAMEMSEDFCCSEWKRVIVESNGVSKLEGLLAPRLLPVGIVMQCPQVMTSN
ncbi:hypothetical protein N9762_03635 [Gammaproteobacteria bacterium]|nr:hypothetical protein [Gammaproteobacteria bacterium]